MIAKFHIGRPYLYKALRNPGALSDDDLEQVRGGLRNAMDWPIMKGIVTRMKSCIPIKFAFCSQYVYFSCPACSSVLPPPLFGLGWFVLLLVWVLMAQILRPGPSLLLYIALAAR